MQKNARKKRILVAPLDWGLGHAARCVPVIYELLAKDCEVILAGDNGALAFLKKEFSSLEYVVIEGYDVKYLKNGSMVFSMLVQLPKFISRIQQEHKELDQIINQYAIDGVISDNRYGLWSNQIPCIFITHQINIKAPFFEKKLYSINKTLIEKFDVCWIPDTADENNFSGDLSHKFPLPRNAHFVGVLSRFSEKSEQKEKEFVLAIVSGPEPQRTLFESLLSKRLKNLNLKAVIVQGKPDKYETKTDGNITYYTHADTKQMQSLVSRASFVICRSGYSSIMDFSALQVPVFFVPTPGQTEQEYLAQHHFSKNGILCCNQSQIQQQEFNEIDTKLPLIMNQSELSAAIQTFLNKIDKK